MSSESENSMNQIYKQRETALRNKIRRSNNLFNLNSSPEDGLPASKIFKTNQDHAFRQEIDGWSDYITNKMNNLASLEEKLTSTEEIIDESVLNKEQALFFESAVDLAKWRQESNDFRRKVKFYLKSKEAAVKVAKHAEDDMKYKMEQIPNEIFNNRARFINTEKM